MNTEEIKRLVSFHTDRITHANAAIKELQSTCRHEGLEGVFQASVDNWGKGEDQFYVLLKCPVCLKAWIEDQSYIQYREGVYYTQEGILFVRQSAK